MGAYLLAKSADKALLFRLLNSRGYRSTEVTDALPAQSIETQAFQDDRLSRTHEDEARPQDDQSQAPPRQEGPGRLELAFRSQAMPRFRRLSAFFAEAAIEAIRIDRQHGHGP